MSQRTMLSPDHNSLSGTEPVQTRKPKTRRSHKKSRNGCWECKRRHMRCDERHPECTPCATAGRPCTFMVYLNRRPHLPSRFQTEADAEGLKASDGNTLGTFSNPDEHAHLQNNSADRDSQVSVGSTITNLDQSSCTTPALQRSSVSTPSDETTPAFRIISDAPSEAIYTQQHMILMHHARTVPNFDRPDRSAVDIAIQYAIDSPYLLDEILAFTAFHLATLHPDSAVHLQKLATELQNRALASFTQLTKVVASDDKATAVPRFLFSAILGRHVLADTLTYCRSDFHVFIDRFVECIHLNRGIKAVTPTNWDYLYKSGMLPFIRVVREAGQKITAPGSECDPLTRVMDDSDLNEASVEACRQAIKLLQWSFDLCHHLDEEDYPQSVSAFSVRIGAGFVDVLRKHRPEALLVLAYYGVLLYRCRGFWAFGDSGASLIRAIAERLGSYWQDALHWPLQVLETEVNFPNVSH